eukprot:scaffold70323_cov66-Phaeocystis_antarctica.AAC.1
MLRAAVRHARRRPGRYARRKQRDPHAATAHPIATATFTVKSVDLHCEVSRAVRARTRPRCGCAWSTAARR